MSGKTQAIKRKIISVDESKRFRHHIVNNNEFEGLISFSLFSSTVSGVIDEGTKWSFYDCCMVRLMKQNGYKLKDPDFFRIHILIPFWMAVEANNLCIITTLTSKLGLSPAVTIKKIVEAYIDESGYSIEKHVDQNDTSAIDLLYRISISEGMQLTWKMMKEVVVSDFGSKTVTKICLTIGAVPVQAVVSDECTLKAKTRAAVFVLKRLAADDQKLRIPSKLVDKIADVMEMEECPSDIKPSLEPLHRTKKLATKLVAFPHLIPDKRLAHQVLLANVTDEAFGPIQLARKRQIGEEYELKLQQMLTDRGIPFKSEDELRRLGYDKTPDVKLITPIAVDGFIINWIDSKAIFVDRDMHVQYKLDQFYSYWNRFGPGMVIYWFGYVKDLVTSEYKKFIVKSDFPDDIQMLGSWKPELNTTAATDEKIDVSSTE